jgi:hypothetical protein
LRRQTPRHDHEQQRTVRCTAIEDVQLLPVHDGPPLFRLEFLREHNQGWSRVYRSHEGYTLVDTGPWWFSTVNCATAGDALASLQCTEDRDLDVSDEKFAAILRQSQNDR